MPLHQPHLLHQLAVVSQMMTAFIVILVMERQWGSLWRVFGVEVELAWCKIMLRLGHAHLMDHLIMHGTTDYSMSVTLHCVESYTTCYIRLRNGCGQK